MTKGLLAYVYRAARGDCTNGGESATADTLLVVDGGLPGIFEPRDGLPVFRLVPGVLNGVRLVPLEPVRPGRVGPMFGGNFAATCDSRWCEAVRALGGQGCQAVPIFDRYE